MRALLGLIASLALSVAAHASDAILLKPHAVDTVRGGYVLGHHTSPIGSRVSILTSNAFRSQIPSRDGDSLEVDTADLRFVTSLVATAVVTPLPTPVHLIAPALTPTTKAIYPNLTASASSSTSCRAAASL